MASWTPVGSLAVVAVGSIDVVDIRTGLFPWAIALAAIGLATTVQGVLNAHAGDPDRLLAVGAWWTTLALLGAGVFFISIAIGGLLDIDEEAAGFFAWPPFLSMVFAVLSMTPAVSVLAWGAQRRRRLHLSGRVALWALAPLVPGLLITVGLVEGSGESVVLVAFLLAFMVAWVVVGRALRRLAPVEKNGLRRRAGADRRG